METDSVNCPQRSESLHESCSETRIDRDSKLTEDRETDVKDHKTEEKDTDLQQQGMLDTGAISRTDKTESPDGDLPSEPYGDHTSLPADGAVETDSEDFSSTAENEQNAAEGQEWPPVPELEDNNQSEMNEDGVKENTETNQDILTPVQDAQRAESVTVTTVHEGSDSPKVTPGESEHDDSDSILFLSENSEEQNIDCTPADFATTKEQWVRQDSCSSEPPTHVFDRSSSKSLLTEPEPSPITQEESVIESQLVQQGGQEAKPVSPAGLNEDKVVQQVCVGAPPLDTVAVEAANQEQASLPCGSTEVKEPLIMTEGWRESEREERVCGETGEGRKQTECGRETGGTDEGRQGEIKDQGQELENKGQRKLESRSNTTAHLEERKVSGMEVEHFDDSQSDSGVSADFSPNSTTDVSDCLIHAAPEPAESPPNETPIEKEIRLAIKREQSLRRSRGLGETIDRTNEFVEIPMRRPILSRDLNLKASQTHGKDRQFAGKKMLMEISAEVEREKVLVDLGRLPGFYDKGSEVQLQEKKLLFEAFQEPKESVQVQSRRSVSNGTNMEFTTETTGTATEESGAVEVRQRLMQFSQNSNPTPLEMARHGCPTSYRSGARGPGLTEGIKGQVIIIEANSIPTTLGLQRSLKSSQSTFPLRSQSAEPIRGSQRQNLEVIQDEDDEDSRMVKENPFFKLRSSMTLKPEVEQDIKEAKEREKELRRQRKSLYGGAEVEPQTDTGREPDLRFREGDKTESGVRQRDGIRTRTSKEIRSPSPQRTTLTPTGRKSDLLSTNTSVRQSTGKLDLTWPPPSHTDEEQRPQSEKILKMPRQRNPLLERWESGKVNGHVDERD